jgi:hypothetical protein
VGRFGLRAAPGGIATPAYGDAPTVVRTAGAWLVVEQGASSTRTPLDGSSLRRLATAAGADIDAPLDVGRDTPALGDPDEPLAVDDVATRRIVDWHGLGWRALDAAAGESSSTIQLWPEHFDAGCDVPVGPGPDDRCNLGASPGDDAHPEPYLYVGPWTPARPGDAAYWNAPFGAVLGAAEVEAGADPVAFLQRGLELLRRSR